MLTEHQYRQAQTDPNFLPWLAQKLDVTPNTVIAFIPEETLKQHPTIETMPGWYRRFSAVAKRIQDRTEVPISIGHAMALARHLAGQLQEKT